MSAKAQNGDAKGRGGDGSGKMTAAKQALRDAAIVERRAAGTPWKEIAAEFGLSVRAAQIAHKKRIEADPIKGKTATELAEWIVDGFRSSIADLEAMAEAYVDQHPSAAVGAKKAANEARRDTLALLQSLGRVPLELGNLRILGELQTFSATVVGSLQEFEAVLSRVLAKEKPTRKDRRELADAAGRVRGVIEQAAESSG